MLNSVDHDGQEVVLPRLFVHCSTKENDFGKCNQFSWLNKNRPMGYDVAHKKSVTLFCNEIATGTVH